MGSVAAAVFLDTPNTCLGLSPAEACVLTVCPDFGHLTGENAGVIEIVGQTQKLALEPTMTAGGTMYSPQPFPGVLSPGAAITISGAGGAVPPFVGMLAFPQSLNGEVFPQSIDTASDLKVGWTPQPGSVVLALAGGSQSAPELICRFDGTHGYGVVPSPLLASLKGGAGSSVSLVLLPIAQVVVGDLGWQYVLEGLGAGVENPVTLQ